MSGIHKNRRLGRVFDSEVQRILDFVARGIGVRVVGAPGSGKTSVVRSVMSNLEKTGVSVHFISGLRTHRTIPYSAIKGLGLEMRPGRSGVFDIADVFSSQLAKAGKHLLVVDDLHLVDSESLAVLEAVRRRSDCPMVATAPETWAFSRVSWPCSTTVGRRTCSWIHSTMSRSTY